MEITTVGLDIAKNIFHAHGVDKNGKIVFQKPLKRKQLLPFFANLNRCVIGIESCASSHYWQRQLEKCGHEVRLISPQFVTPYVKSNKNDARDAEAICEAVSRPNMRFVPRKSVEQHDIQMIHRVRSRLVKQRTALANQIRGLLGEYGIIIPQGIAHIRKQIPLILEDGENELTPLSREIFFGLYEELLEFDKQITCFDQRLKRLARANTDCQKLQAIPGIGPTIATALLMSVGSAKEFKNGRHMAAWMGLVPKQHSSGGKSRLLGISKRGDSYLRTLLVHGARAVASKVKNNPQHENQWLYKLIERRGLNKACVAYANKMARQAWVLLTKDEVYRNTCVC